MNEASYLTEQFYYWEQRGRGWRVYERPIELEPPFVPFFFQSPARSRAVIDDGRRPTFLSSIVDQFRRGSPNVGVEEFPDPVDSRVALPDAPCVDVRPQRELTVSLSADARVTAEQVDQFLLALSFFRFPASFEILGTSALITVHFTCSEQDLPHLEGALRSYFPGITSEHSERTLHRLEGHNAVVVDFGLSEEFMRPLRTFQYFEPDPLTGVIAAMENLNEGEVGLLQILFHATRQPWTESILRSVGDGEGGSFFADDPNMPRLAHEKTSRPLFACVVRAIGASVAEDRAWDVVRRIASGVLPATSSPSSNELIPLTNDDYAPATHFGDVLQRRSHRSGMLLSSRELATLVHPPSLSIGSSKLQRHITRTRRARLTETGTYVLGENYHQGHQTTVTLSVRQRLNHMYVIGATGTGKSTLLHNLIVQDIEQGHGVAVVDPHGDLIERVISCIPRRRLKDVVLFDPSDAQNPIGINILSARGEAEKNVAASDLVAVFKRMSTSWGDQMTVVLGNAIQAFLESDRGGTLLDLRRFLIEEDFRKEFLKTVRDPDVRYFWEKQHHILRGNTLGSLLTRLDVFLRPKVIRNVVAPKVELRFWDLLEHQKILLVKLAQGLIGEENASLLGTLVVSKLHQAAMARQSLPANDRTPFFLYIDEFQNFITPSLAGVLSGTRKYGLGLILTHQDLRQVFNQDSGVANSVISNPGTRICFRLGDFDAQKLQEGLAHFTSNDLLNLGLGEAVTRVDTADNDFNLKIFPPRAVNPETAKSRRKRVIELSHEIPGHEVVSETQIPTAESSEPTVEEAPPQPIKPLVNREITVSTRQNFVSESEQPLALLPETEEKIPPQHRYLQALIKRMAEERGYRAVIEEPTPDGLGRVDVGLERDGERIACEISVTTTDDHEIQNIQKCLVAGYHKVVVCSVEKRRLDKIQAAMLQKVKVSDQSRVLFFEPQELFRFLERADGNSVTTEKRIKGYRVKVAYEQVDEAERQNKRNAVAHVILQSMRRMKGK